MPQVTVAMLDIDKREAGPLRQLAARTKSSISRAISSSESTARSSDDVEPSVEIRMAINDPRLEAALFIGPGEAAGVRELKPD